MFGGNAGTLGRALRLAIPWEGAGRGAERCYDPRPVAMATASVHGIDRNLDAVHPDAAHVEHAVELERHAAFLQARPEPSQRDTR